MKRVVIYTVIVAIIFLAVYLNVFKEGQFGKSSSYVIPSESPGAEDKHNLPQKKNGN